MDAAKTFPPATEQAHSSVRPQRKSQLDRPGLFLEFLWRIRDAMRTAKPAVENSETSDHSKSSLHWSSPSENVSRTIILGEFKIAATSIPADLGLPGWRITTINQETGLEHQYFVRQGQIHHVQFQSPPPWDHLTQFVVGARVKRMLDAEKQAILQAIAGS